MQVVSLLCPGLIWKPKLWLDITKIILSLPVVYEKLIISSVCHTTEQIHQPLGREHYHSPVKGTLQNVSTRMGTSAAISAEYV